MSIKLIKNQLVFITLIVVSFVFGMGNALVSVYKVFGDFPHEIIGSLVLGALLAEMMHLKYFKLIIAATKHLFKLYACIPGILHLGGYLSTMAIHHNLTLSHATFADWIRLALTLGYYVITIGLVTSGFFVFSLFLIGEYRSNIE